MNQDLKSLIKEFYPFAKQKLGFQKPVKIILTQDKENAKNPLGKTAYYDPENISITLYITERHIKDILRSLSHELTHHYQYCNGQMKDDRFVTGENYFQKSKYMRALEEEAYSLGNLIFRDFEESKKND